MRYSILCNGTPIAYFNSLADAYIKIMAIPVTSGLVYAIHDNR